MTMLIWVAATWLALAVLGWSWLAAAARADRTQLQRPPTPPSPPRARPRH